MYLVTSSQQCIGMFAWEGIVCKCRGNMFSDSDYTANVNLSLRKMQPSFTMKCKETGLEDWILNKKSLKRNSAKQLLSRNNLPQIKDIHTSVHADPKRLSQSMFCSPKTGKAIWQSTITQVSVLYSCYFVNYSI